MFDEFRLFVQTLGFDYDHQHDPQHLLCSSASFVHVFSKIFNVSTDVIFQHLNDPTLESLKQALLFKEFNCQKRWIENVVLNDSLEFIPILYSCAIISIYFHYDIILICGSLTLSNIHKSSRLVRFCAKNNNGNFVVVGLDDKNIFKILRCHETQDFVLNFTGNIPEHALIHVDFEYSDEELVKFKSSINIDSNYQLNDSSSESDQNIENMTIREYVQQHTTITPAGFKVLDESFSNNKKIDIQTSDFRFEHECIPSFQRSYDIDAFIGLFKGFELHNCLDSGGDIVKFKDFTKSKKDKASLKKLFEECNKKDLVKYKFVKFAELESTSTYEIYAVAAASKNCDGMNALDLKSCLESAHLYANRFPCISINCIHSNEHLATRNGRPDYHTQIKTHTFKWDYEKKSFKCLLKSMLEYLENAVSNIDGVQMFYYVKSIGSKFKTIFTSLNDMNKVIKSFLSPFNLHNLLALNESKFFVDVAWNISPDHNYADDKVF